MHCWYCKEELIYKHLFHHGYVYTCRESGNCVITKSDSYMRFNRIGDFLIPIMIKGRQIGKIANDGSNHITISIGSFGSKIQAFSISNLSIKIGPSFNTDVNRIMRATCRLLRSQGIKK
jgi:hypothetical protein